MFSQLVSFSYKLDKALICFLLNNNQNMPGSNYTYINTATTTVIGSQTNRRVNTLGIFINKTSTGTIVIKTGATTIGNFAVGTTPGSYWLTDGGMEIYDLQIVTSAADDIVVAWNNL